MKLQVFSSNHRIGRRRYSTKLQPRHGWPELTALADILFLALLFFFLSGSFVWVTGIPVELPHAAPVMTASLERFIVTMRRPVEKDAAILYYFNDRPVKHDELKALFNQMHSHSRTASIIIRADRNVPTGKTYELMSMAGAEGLSCFLAGTIPEEQSEIIFGK